jgi:hypothetical protein
MKLKSINNEGGDGELSEKYYIDPSKYKSQYNMKTFNGVVKSVFSDKLFGYFKYNKNKIYCYLEDFKKMMNEEDKKKIDAQISNKKITNESPLYLFLTGRGKSKREISSIIAKEGNGGDNYNCLTTALSQIEYKIENTSMNGYYDDQIDAVNKALYPNSLQKTISDFKVDTLDDIISNTVEPCILLYSKLFSDESFECVAIQNEKVLGTPSKNFEQLRKNKDLVILLLLQVK